MKNLINSIIVMAILTGCAQSGRVIQTTFDPVTGKKNTVELSEYFESKNMIAGGDLQAHLIVTLGSERIPTGYKLKEKVDRFQDQIEEVTEIYFSNKGEEPITIKNVFLQSNSQKLIILPNSITVMPGKWVKSEPIVGVTSVYRPDIESVLHYEHNGKNYTASLPEIRTPVAKLKR